MKKERSELVVARKPQSAGRTELSTQSSLQVLFSSPVVDARRVDQSRAKELETGGVLIQRADGAEQSGANVGD